MKRKFFLIRHIAAICLFFVMNQPVFPITLRVYFIGNSVTDAINYAGLKAIAESNGNTHIWGRHMIPGAPLEWLWDHRTEGFMEEPYGYPENAFTNYTWDAISLQPFDRLLDDDKTVIGNYVNLAKGKSPDVQFYIYMRWPRTPDNKAPTDPSLTADTWNSLWTRTYTGGWDGTNETKDYFEKLMLACRSTYTTVKPFLIVPVGEVFYSLNNKMKNGQVPGYSKIWQLYSDGIHMTSTGSYVVGLTFYATLYKKDPRGTSVPSQYGTIPSDVVTVIQNTVWEVVSTYQYSGVSGGSTVPVTGVSVSPTTLSLTVGQTSQLTATVTPSNATNKAVTWSSSNALVASVNSSGLVTAAGAGTATITVTTVDGNKTATCNVTVTASGGSDTQAPSKASNLSASNIKDTKFDLSWTHATDNVGVTGYDVYVGSTKKNTSRITTNSFQVTGLTACTQYSVTVKAYDAAGNSSTSNALTVKTNCAPVAVLNASPLSGNAPLQVSFNATGSSDPDAGDFILGYQWNFGDGSPINNSNAPTHTYNTPGTYTVTLKVMDNRDMYSTAITKTITVYPANALSAGKETGLLLYPNPAEDVLYLKPGCSSAETITIRMLDETGKVWMEKETAGSSETLFEINVSSLFPGVYMIQTLTGKDIQVQKFIKK